MDPARAGALHLREDLRPVARSGRHLERTRSIRRPGTAVSVETTAEQEAAAAIVRAIRKVYGSHDGIGGVDQFRVENVHQFARRLLKQGVTAHEEPAS
jgi:hypothetical protein